jgi:Alkylmercury lyase
VHTRQDGEIMVAYPFSGRTTDHIVRFKGGHEVHAMCAIDALGMAPMFDQSIEVVSRDQVTGERIEIDLRPDGTGDWQPDQAVVVCGASGDGESCRSCCPVLNFFASPENGERWLAERPDVQGYVMTMAEAIEAGRTVFGDVLAAA